MTMASEPGRSGPGGTTAAADLDTSDHRPVYAEFALRSPATGPSLKTLGNSVSRSILHESNVAKRKVNE